LACTILMRGAATLGTLSANPFFEARRTLFRRHARFNFPYQPDQPRQEI